MNQQELRRLISGLVDNRLTGEEQTELESILENDPQARSLYMRYVDLDVELDSMLVSARPDTAHRRWWPLAAAAAFVLGLLLIKLSTDKPPGARWQADFETQNSEGWVGQWTTHGAPGAKGALSSITLTNTWGVFHQLRTPERWDKGLFKIESDSHLHFIYRVETARWFDIFFVTRARDSAEPQVVLHIFRDEQLWSEPGRWRSATVPLSLFKRKVDGRFVDVPPVVGEAPAQLFFSAEENGLQLTIDRIWVSRGGPGKLEINEVK
jgi:hypothetical protein